MTDNKIVTGSSERGVALVTVLLMLALLLALAMGTTLTAISELGVARTYGTQTLALEAAEAGLHHATSLTMNFTGEDFTALLGLRGPNQAFPTTTANFAGGVSMIVATDEHGYPILQQGGAQMPATEERGLQLRDANNSLVPSTYYSVRLIDDEANGAVDPSVPNFNPGNTWPESVGANANNPNIDNNNRLVIYSTGKYANSSVTLEGWIAYMPYPALAANGNVQVTGSADIRGTYGGVHSNKDLEVSNAATISQSATATGTATITNSSNIGGFIGGNQAELYIPPFVTKPVIDSAGRADASPRLRDFLVQQADRVLIDPGYLDGAHNNDPNGVGVGVTSTASGRLRALADKLGVSYASLASAINQSSSGGRVDQTVPVVVNIDRSSSPPRAEKINGRNEPSDSGWSYTGGSNASWGILTNDNGQLAGGHTYYVVGQDNYNTSSPGSSTKNGGNVVLTGNVGSANNPGEDPEDTALAVSILATGSIEVGGTPNIKSNIQDLRTPLLPPFVTIDVLMVATEDIKINGDYNANINFSGISFAGEQVELSGNGRINGQIISLSNRNVSGSPVNSELNTATGSFELTLNRGNSIGRITLYTWRQIKR